VLECPIWTSEHPTQVNRQSESTTFKNGKKRLFNLSNLRNWAKKRKVQTSDTDGDKEDMSLIIFSKIECQTKQKIQVAPERKSTASAHPNIPQTVLQSHAIHFNCLYSPRDIESGRSVELTDKPSG
jgi:hypothetical protein